MADDLGLATGLIELRHGKSGLSIGETASSLEVPSSVIGRSHPWRYVSRVTNQPDEQYSERHEGTTFEPERHTVGAGRQYGEDDEDFDLGRDVLHSEPTFQRREIRNDTRRTEESTLRQKLSGVSRMRSRNPTPPDSRDRDPPLGVERRSVRRLLSNILGAGRGKEPGDVRQAQSVPVIESRPTVHSTISRDLTAGHHTHQASQLAELGQKLSRCSKNGHQGQYDRKRKRQDSEDEPVHFPRSQSPDSDDLYGRHSRREQSPAGPPRFIRATSMPGQPRR